MFKKNSCYKKLSVKCERLVVALCPKLSLDMSKRKLSNQAMADCIISGGTIHSMDENCPHPEAVAIAGDKIVAVGNKAKIIKDFGCKNTNMLELNEKETLMPGFIEAHSHAVAMALSECVYVTCSAYYYDTKKKVHELFVKTIAETDPASKNWCIFFGWDPEMINDLPQLGLDKLDEYSTEIPIYVVAQNGHTSWANRKAFEIAEIEDSVINPDGGTFVRDEDGKLTGQMMESAAGFLVVGHAPRPTREEVRKALDAQWKDLSKAGFTTVTDLAYLPEDNMDEMLEELAKQEECPIRIALYVRDNVSKSAKTCCDIVPRRDNKSTKSIQENENLWVAGTKLICDGSPHCGTAATYDDYLSNELTELLGFPTSYKNGKLNYEKDDDLLNRMKDLHGQGKQMAIHAHGERAIDQVLRLLEMVVTSVPKEGLDHRIEHLGLCQEEHIKKAAKINASMSFFVQHLYFYGSSYTEFIFGADRTDRWAPVSLALKHNLLWTIHQDHPAFPGPIEPFANLMTAVTRTERYKPDKVYGPNYRIPIEEALKGYTINAAKQIRKDGELGSITLNKKADLVILSDDPVKVGNEDPFKLVDIKVVDTFLNGRKIKHN